RHVVDGRRLWERENINGLNLVLKRVVKLLSYRDAGELAADFGFDVGVFERAFGPRLAVTTYRLERALRDFAGRGLDHAGIVLKAEIVERRHDGQKTNRRADQRKHKSSFHHFFSLFLRWTH